MVLLGTVDMQPRSSGPLFLGRGIARETCLADAGCILQREGPAVLLELVKSKQCNLPCIVALATGSGAACHAVWLAKQTAHDHHQHAHVMQRSHLQRSRLLRVTTSLL